LAAYRCSFFANIRDPPKMSAPHQKTRVHINGWTKRFKRLALLLLLGTVLVSLTVATASVTGAANTTQPSVGAATHPIQYWIGCAPSMVTTANLNYFKQQGFNAVCVVVPDAQTYATQLDMIKSFNMQPIIDIEMPIWNGGQLQSTPISNFAGYFQSLKNAGWQYVASEGGRTGDLEYMQNYFKGYVNFNCDQCGLWKGEYPVYTNPFTVANSWESYYPAEWPSIQTGSKAAAALGIQNGLLAGTWANNGGYNQIYANSVSGSGTPSYKSMLDWSYANGIGFTSFHVWCGDNPNGLSQYKSLGFDKIVANLQTYYPATPALLGTGEVVVGAPAVSSQHGEGLDLFVQGTNGALLWKHRDGTTWSSWESLGGVLTSVPAATSPAPGVIEVFARGTTGGLYEISTTNGGSSWSAWSRIGGQGQLLTNTGPSARSWVSGSTIYTEVFITGTNTRCYYIAQAGNAPYGGWQNLGGGLTSSPAAASPASGAIDVFARGTTGALYENSYYSGSWHGWISLGGGIAPSTGPGVCSWGPGRLDVFVQGTTGALYHKWYTGTWSGWENLGGGLTSSPAAASPASGAIDVFVRGTTGNLYEKTYTHGWSAWTSIGGI
jgi:Repeat of unknown function (DUF346)